MTRHTRIRRDPAGQLHRAVLLAAVAACVGVVIYVTQPLLVRQFSVEDQALPNLDRWLTVLGFFSVAVMLGALVWVVRVAASITSSDAGNAWAPRVPERESIGPRPPMGDVTLGAAFPERVLTVSRAIVGVLDPSVLTQRHWGPSTMPSTQSALDSFWLTASPARSCFQAGLRRNGEAIAPQGHSVRLGYGRLGAAVAGFESHVSSETAESLILHPDPGCGAVVLKRSCQCDIRAESSSALVAE